MEVYAFAYLLYTLYYSIYHICIGMGSSTYYAVTSMCVLHRTYLCVYNIHIYIYVYWYICIKWMHLDICAIYNAYTIYILSSSNHICYILYRAYVYACIYRSSVI